MNKELKKDLKKLLKLMKFSVMLIRKQPLTGMEMISFTEVEVEETEDIQKKVFQETVIFILQTHLISLEHFLEIRILSEIPLRICFQPILTLHIHTTITMDLVVSSMLIIIFLVLEFMSISLMISLPVQVAPQPHS